jgi:hypothetical protein
MTIINKSENKFFFNTIRTKIEKLLFYNIIIMKP